MRMRSSSSNSWPKWQIALAVGAPVAAIGLTYLYFKKSKPKTKLDVDRNNLNKSYDNSSEKSSKLGGDAKASKKDEVIVDPYERAKSSKNKGNKLFRAGKFDRAIECYTEAISVCPPQNKEDIATFYQNRAAAHENLKNYTEVIRDCTHAIELNQKYTKALSRRAKAYEAVNELQKCLEDITAVCILEGFQNQASLEMTDRVLKNQGKVKAKEAIKNRVLTLPSKHFVKNFFISFSEDPVMKAVEKYKEKSKTQNVSDLSGYRLVLHLLTEELFEEVMPACTTEIERKGTDMAEAYLIRGTFMLLQGQIETAMEDLEKLLELESVDIKVRVNALIKVGTLKVHSDQMDEALGFFNKAIEIDPNNADIYLHRGQVYLLLDRVDETLRDMEKSSALNPNFPSAVAQKCFIQYRCGMRYNDNKQRDEALKGFEETQKKFPKCSESYFLYAQVLSEREEFEKAEEFFLKAGELDPTDPNVYVHRGILRLQWKQDIDGAVKLLNKAIDLDEKCQFAYETLGSIEVQRGQLGRGLELFRKAIQLAQTENELAHLYSLHDAAEAQSKVVERLGIQIGFNAENE